MSKAFGALPGKPYVSTPLDRFSNIALAPQM